VTEVDRSVCFAGCVEIELMSVVVKLNMNLLVFYTNVMLVMERASAALRHIAIRPK
jgi:hypothetical protein